MTPRLPAIRAAAALAGLVVVLFTCVTAQGATLVGGREQSKIAVAFFARGAHRGQVIVSTRASAVKRTWVVVKSVRPTRGGGTGSASTPVTLHSTYYHLTATRVKAAQPPATVRADLTRTFRVAVVYTGSGSETITYKQPYKSVCAGAGEFTDEQDDTIAPMSWSVRYVVDLDDLQSAVRSSAGTALVPSVGFYRSLSKVSARQTLTRTAIDEGCNGRPTTFTCRLSYAPGAASDGLLSLPATGGLTVGVPITSTGVGDCDPSDYTLGPSLWDSGATTAFTARLGLVGGGLPTDPYAPVKVSWPADGVALTQGFIASPCQGDGLACRDAFSWTGQIVLQPVG
jgi:hypothetical protein